MRVLVVGCSWAVLALLGILGVPASPEIFFPRTNAGGWMLIGATLGFSALALVLMMQRRTVWIVLSGVVFVLGMLPFVGMMVEQAKL